MIERFDDGDRRKKLPVATIIPCYRSEKSIASVVNAIPAAIEIIVCVDDASDDATALELERLAKLNERVSIVRHTQNQGVGGATVSGYYRALELGAGILVKIDSDGQMDPAMIPCLTEPIERGQADYTKGNRFFDPESVRTMPVVRLFGNAVLSFATKLATGYWHIFDPTNGYTALHADVARSIPLEKLHQRYFFESDMLFRLATLRARVIDVPMSARYAGEESHLDIWKTMFSFPLLHIRNFAKRILYSYFIRGFSVASLSLLIGLPLIAFGAIYGASAWLESHESGLPATAGTVMLSAFPILVGLQLVLHFLHFDVESSPKHPVARGLGRNLRSLGRKAAE